MWSSAKLLAKLLNKVESADASFLRQFIQGKGLKAMVLHIVENSLKTLVR
jgi:hypothetical protein